MPEDWSVYYGNDSSKTDGSSVKVKAKVTTVTDAETGTATENPLEKLTVTNVVPTASISVTKQWKDSKDKDREPDNDAEKTISFKVYYNVVGESVPRLYTEVINGTAVDILLIKFRQKLLAYLQRPLKRSLATMWLR